MLSEVDDSCYDPNDPEYSDYPEMMKVKRTLESIIDGNGPPYIGSPPPTGELLHV